MKRNMNIREADWGNRTDREAVLMLINAYSRDPMGQGRELSEKVKRSLVNDLSSHPTSRVLLAFVDRQPVGILVAFGNYSTFQGRRLYNVHDLVVLSDFRGQGVGRVLLETMESIARSEDCCRLSLEVRQDNIRARTLYDSAGFVGTGRSGDGSAMEFWEKELN